MAGSAGPARIGVGLLGCGTVGSQVYRLLAEQEAHIAQRTGLRFAVAGIAVAHPDRPRPVPAGLLAPDAMAVVADPAVDVVVEVIGGIEPALGLVRRALALGKPVVTANKQLIARHGAELLAAADRAGVDLHFEAAVGASTPLVKPLRESLAVDRIRSIEGILNGTTNYILTRMTADGWTFAEALAEAQRRGFAEADPTDDVEGHDAAAKIAILASVAFGAQVGADQVYHEGIGRITPRDIGYARELGYTVKLLAVARDGGSLDVRVHPALLPHGHPLASVPDERNAVLVEGESSGSLVFIGPGAGGAPTAVAVLGDIVDVGRNLRHGAGGRVGRVGYAARPIRPIGELVIPYYVGLQVLDRPGVFAKVAGAFGDEMVSLASVVQKSRGEYADVVLLTHDAEEAALRRVVARLEAMEAVGEVGCVIRVAD